MSKQSFTVWCPEQGETADDGRAFDAFDAEEAAEQWAEQDDWSSAEYSIVGQRSTPIVHVQGPSGDVQRFRVSGEAVPSYSAEHLEDADPGSPPQRVGSEGEKTDPRGAAIPGNSGGAP
jgi:hypothetical protein